jgi:Zn-dependent alcohol dehydrogenase
VRAAEVKALKALKAEGVRRVDVARRLDPHPTPCVLEHESAAIVEAVGERASVYRALTPGSQ